MVNRINKRNKDYIKRKEQGKYYTPEFITEYICLNTIIPNLSNKSSRTIKNLIEEFSGNIEFLETKIRKIKIIDPACGHGVFLLKSTEILLKIYKEIYKIKQDNRDFKDIPLNIIKNNIFGVDLDAEAVESTKEILIEFCISNSEIGVSPDLSNNIILGDSLFSTGNERIKNYLNWKSTFPHIFAQGGFDIVVGNPPYVDIKELDPDTVENIFEKYSTAKNRTNLYSIFIERSVEKILKNSGYLGYIIPNSLLMNSSYSLIRNKLLEMTEIKEIMRLPNKIFKNVSVETIILILKKINNPAISPVKIIKYSPSLKISSIDPSEFSSSFEITPQYWLSDEYNRFRLKNNKIYKILEKIESDSILLGSGDRKLCDFSLGITPYDKYKGHTKEQIRNQVFHSEKKIDESYKPLLSGGDITRYLVVWSGRKYIKYGSWLGAQRNARFFTEPRIIVRQIVSGSNPRILAAYTDEELYNTQTVFSVIVRENNAFEVKYILALLNSKLMNFYHRNKFLDENKMTFQKILIENAKKFPVKHPNLKIQSIISNLVDLLMEKAKKIRDIFQNGNVNPTIDAQRLIQEFELLDSEIDGIIYKIYNLDADEVSLIENIY